MKCYPNKIFKSNLCNMSLSGSELCNHNTPRTVASFTMEVNSRSAKRLLKTNGHLANRELTSLVIEANAYVRAPNRASTSAGAVLTSSICFSSNVPACKWLHTSCVNRIITFKMDDEISGNLASRRPCYNHVFDVTSIHVHTNTRAKIKISGNWDTIKCAQTIPWTRTGL